MNKIQYNGKNFCEVNDFSRNALAWESSQMYWTDDNPPADLKITSSEFEGELSVGDCVCSKLFVLKNEQNN